MTRIERSIAIASPPHEVFDVLCDPKQVPHWATIAESFPQSLEAPFTTGQAFDHAIRLSGVRLDARWRVVEYDAPRTVEYDVEGMAGGWLKMRQIVTPISGGSNVELEIDYGRGDSLAGSSDQVYVERRNEREAENSLNNLKHLVEARGNKDPQTSS